ncbi:MAG: OmpA family protein [Erythrobacter sp.]|nr:MAG: OmpA family protein [Erythrobacter sp.]
MKNFLLGALAMLVLLAGGYSISMMLIPGEEASASVAGDDPPKDTRVAAMVRTNGNGGTLVFIGGENAVAKTLEAAEEAEASANAATPPATTDSDPRPAPAVTATATAAPGDPPPPRGVCISGPYTVYFDSDSSSVNASAAETLNRVAQHYRLNCQGASVSLAGHTDEGSGRRQAVRLSERMAASVAQYLGSRGVPSGSISSEAFGRSQLRVATDEDASDPQNRRVEITFGR